MLIILKNKRKFRIITTNYDFMIWMLMWQKYSRLRIILLLNLVSDFFLSILGQNSKKARVLLNTSFVDKNEWVQILELGRLAQTNLNSIRILA